MGWTERIGPTAGGGLLRLAIGLIGGGILAATKGFAQGSTRPVLARDTALAGSATLLGEVPVLRRFGVSGRPRGPSAVLDEYFMLKLDKELGHVRETGAGEAMAQEDSPPLKVALTLRMAEEQSRASHANQGDGLAQTGLIASLTLAAAEDRSGTPGQERTPGGNYPVTVLARSGVLGTAGIAAAADQVSPVQIVQGTSPVRSGGGEEPPAPESPVPLEAVIPGASPRRPGSSSPVSSPGNGPLGDLLPDLGGSGYRMAPIRWGGTTGSSVVWSQDAIGSQVLSNTQNLDMRANSYIYQPWFARIGGNLGVVSAESKITGGASGGGSSNRNNSTSFNYGGDLSLFPVSRFPFQANFSQNSNVATAQDQSITSTSTRFGVRQNYRPEQGNDNYSANYDRSLVTTVTGNSVVNAAGATYATLLGDHTLSSSVRYSSNSGDVGGQSLQLFGASAAHTWRRDEDFMISTSANFSNSQTNILSGGVMALNNSRLWQANSSVVWTPDQDIPLTVTGGGSLFAIQTDTGIDKSQLLSMNGYATANYRFSPNLGLTGSASLGQNQTKDTKGTSLSTVNSTQTASVSYSGDPLKLFDFSYGWNTGGSFSNQMTSGGAGQNLSGQTIGANASHSLSRVFMFSPVNTLNTYASQGLSFSKASNSVLSNTTLSHSAGASWRSAYSETLVGSLSVAGSDSISSGQSENHFRTFSVNGTGQWQMNRRAGFNAAVNATWTQQVTASSTVPGAGLTATDSSTPAQWSGSGSLSYSHRNPLDIQNLLYGATYSFTTSQTNLRVAAGDPNAVSWVVSNTFLQRLDYILGRVKFQLTGSLATIDGKSNASIFFSMQRAFGDL